ncbi:MAG TPA: FG-GAP-like repeat-containing protein, partial [bacterium]|nr:FG-GAP-like repeat-containing protein [bacterium]
TFTNVAPTAGVALAGTIGMGATWSDWDGDGWLDLFVGGIENDDLVMFRNDGDGTFTEITAATGVNIPTDTFSATFGDIDNDDDLDLLMAHWNVAAGPGHVWKNDGDGTFTESDLAVGYVGWDSLGIDYSFTFNLADLDDDGWMDMLVASDYETSHVFMNDGDGTFTDATDHAVIKDDNGMGAAVADYDRDGDLDWFVSSILNASKGKVGNRMYRNNGGGVLEDISDSIGVADGLWGWAAVMQDFNNDGWLDIYHVNGWTTPMWQQDSSRMFVSDGDGTFTEMASALGVADAEQGRGVCSFDYDRDGDIDLFITNNTAPAVLYRNDGGNDNGWLQVKLIGLAPNTEAIGARIYVTVGSVVQMWEMRCGNNFLSQDPAEAHFGLAGQSALDELRVEWTDGTVDIQTDVPGNRRLVLVQGSSVGVPAVPRPTGITLHDPAPNPFRTGTTLRFSIAADGPVAVRIHDAGGRLVRTLADGRRPAGSHSLDWDGRDRHGGMTAAGVYYFEVRTGTERARGTLVRVR